MTNVHEILDGLDEAERRVLYDQLAYQYDRKRPASLVELQLGQEYIYAFEALLGACRAKRDRSLFVRNYGIDKFKRDVDLLNDYVTNASGKLTVAQRGALTYEVLVCLVKEVAMWNNHRGTSLAGSNPHQHALTPEHILTLVRGHLAAAVERCYPGYATAGLLDRVVLMTAA